MIFRAPAANDPIDQGDLINACPVLSAGIYDLDKPGNSKVAVAPSRVLVLTQTCDLANQKAAFACVAVVRDAQSLVEKQLLKVADIRGPIRAGRVFGWYFLPKNTELGLPEMIVDLRQLHTVRLDLLTEVPARSTASAGAATVSGASRQALRGHLQPHRAAGTLRYGLKAALSLPVNSRVIIRRARPGRSEGRLRGVADEQAL